MTEAEWLESNDPKQMVTHCWEEMSQRQLRLFVCGCCRRIDALTDEEGREALLTAELSADKSIPKRTRNEWRQRVRGLREDLAGRRSKKDVLARCAAFALEMCLIDKYFVAGTGGATLSPIWIALTNAEYAGALHSVPGTAFGSNKKETKFRDIESAHQSRIARDIIGNPFHRVKFAKKWRTPTAIGVAQQMYDAREFAAMPILADAMQDAGCEDADVLAHCRGAGPHVRGCWVVDLVLGKS